MQGKLLPARARRRKRTQRPWPQLRVLLPQDQSVMNSGKSRNEWMRDRLAIAHDRLRLRWLQPKPPRIGDRNIQRQRQPTALCGRATAALRTISINPSGRCLMRDSQRGIMSQRPVHAG